MKDTLYTIEKPGEGFYKDKGSKFHAYAFPVLSEEEIKDHLARLRKEHHAARHHCYAWRLGTGDTAFRANDDGEPSSTAGKPILGQLQHFDVTNILLVVVRYFGGTLLGTSGLVHAYKSAAADALSHVKIVTKTIEHSYRLHFSYPLMNEIMNSIKQHNYTVVNTKFETDCMLDFSVRQSEAPMAEELFSSLHGVSIQRLG